MDAFAHCENLVREADKDRFLSSLFAPVDRRPDLLALYAFNAEVANVQDKVREPLAGEVRLQYWHDLIARAGEPGANPVALALLEILKRHAMPRQLLLDLLEARRFDVYDETFSTRADLENYAARTSSALERSISPVIPATIVCPYWVSCTSASDTQIGLRITISLPAAPELISTSSITASMIASPLPRWRPRGARQRPASRTNIVK